MAVVRREAPGRRRMRNECMRACTSSRGRTVAAGRVQTQHVCLSSQAVHVSLLTPCAMALPARRRLAIRPARRRLPRPRPAPIALPRPRPSHPTPPTSGGQLAFRPHNTPPLSLSLSPQLVTFSVQLPAHSPFHRHAPQPPVPLAVKNPSQTPSPYPPHPSPRFSPPPGRLGGLPAPAASRAHESRGRAARGAARAARPKRADLRRAGRGRRAERLGQRL